MNKKTLKEEKYEHITHPFPPLYDADSKILILGESSIGQIQRADVLLRASAEPVLEGDQCGAS